MTHLIPPDRRPGWTSAPIARGRGVGFAPPRDRSSLKVANLRGIPHPAGGGKSVVTTMTERTGHEQ